MDVTRTEQNSESVRSLNEQPAQRNLAEDQRLAWNRWEAQRQAQQQACQQQGRWGQAAGMAIGGLLQPPLGLPARDLTGMSLGLLAGSAGAIDPDVLIPSPRLGHRQALAVSKIIGIVAYAASVWLLAASV